VGVGVGAWVSIKGRNKTHPSGNWVEAELEGCDSGNWWNWWKRIPEAEPVPQYSRSLNRMYPPHIQIPTDIIFPLPSNLVFWIFHHYKIILKSNYRFWYSVKFSIILYIYLFYCIHLLKSNLSSMKTFSIDKCQKYAFFRCFFGFSKKLLFRKK